MFRHSVCAFDVYNDILLVVYYPSPLSIIKRCLMGPEFSPCSRLHVCKLLYLFSSDSHFHNTVCFNQVKNSLIYTLFRLQCKYWHQATPGIKCKNKGFFKLKKTTKTKKVKPVNNLRKTSTGIHCSFCASTYTYLNLLVSTVSSYLRYFATITSTFNPTVQIYHINNYW